MSQGYEYLPKEVDLYKPLLSIKDERAFWLLGLLLLEDPSWGLRKSPRSEVLGVLIQRLVWFLTRREERLSFWNSLRQDIYASDLSLQFVDPTDCSRSWPETQAKLALIALTRAAVSNLEGDFERAMINVNFACDYIETHYGAIVRSRFVMPPEPSAPLYAERCLEITKVKDAEARRTQLAGLVSDEVRIHHLGLISGVDSELSAKRGQEAEAEAARFKALPFYKRWWILRQKAWTGKKTA